MATSYYDLIEMFFHRIEKDRDFFNYFCRNLRVAAQHLKDVLFYARYKIGTYFLICKFYFCLRFKNGIFEFYCDSTYQSLVGLCAYLCSEFDLNPEDVIRHYDVTGKICPKYFVDHPEEWETFHEDVKKAIRALD